MTDFATLGMGVDSSGLTRGQRELRNLERQGARAEGKLTKNSQAIGAAWRGMAAAAGVAVAGLAAAFGAGKVAKEAERYELRLSRINAILKATGGVAGRTSKQLEAQAQSLARASLESVDGVMAAQQTLLTFRNVQGEVFDGAISAALDLSAAIGTDLKSSVLQIAKALEDPVTGMTALTRSGTVFTEAQKEMVKQMVATGQIAEAQSFILAELNSQYGGAADAVPRLSSAQDSLSQSMENARRRMNDVLGLTDKMAAIVESADTAVQFFAENMETVVGTIIAASTAIAIKFLPMIGAAISATYAWIAALVTLKGALIATGIGAVVVLAGYLIGKFITLIEKTGSLGSAFVALKDIAVEAFGRIPDLITGMAMKTQASTLEMRADFLGAIADMLGELGPFSNAVIRAFVGPYKAVVAAWNALPGAFKRIGALAINGLVEVVSSGLTALIAPINSILESVKLPPIPEPDLSGWKATVPEAQGVGAAISDALSGVAGTDYVGEDGVMTERLRSMQSEMQSTADMARDMGQAFIDSATRPLESLKQLDAVLNGEGEQGQGGETQGDPTTQPGGVGGGVGASGGAGGAGGGLLAKLKTLNSLIGRMSEQDPRAAIEEWHGEAMAALADANLIERGMLEEHNAYKLRIEQLYQDQIAELRRNKQNQALGEAADFFGSMQKIAQQGGEGALKAAQIFGAAEALINTYVAASQTLADPTLGFFAKLGAVASVIAAGMGFVNAIRQTSKASSSAAAPTAGGIGGGGVAPQSQTQSAEQSSGGVTNIELVGDVFSRESVQQLLTEQLQGEMDRGGRIVFS